MINDLQVPIITTKYVDDTTVAEGAHKGKQSHAQHSVNLVDNWSSTNHMQIEFSDVDSKRWNLKKLSGGAANRIIMLLRYLGKCKV